MTTTRLDLYVDQECPGCEVARMLVRQVRAMLPQVEVTVIDLSDPGAQAPAQIFAIPTYVINGKTVSLGNPDIQDLIQKLLDASKASEAQ